jgi:hypothetical protein
MATMPNSPKKRPTTSKKITKSASRKRSVTAKAVKPMVVPARPHGLARLNYQTWMNNRSEYRAKRKPLPSVWHITKVTSEVLWRYKKLFLGIIVVYALLNVVLVQGFASSNGITSWHNSVENTVHGHFSKVGDGLASFTILAGTSSSGSSSSSGAYQIVLVLIVSLSLIWALRQVIGGTKVRIRDAYYKGAFPLVPFIILLFIIGLELLPALIGGTLYTLVMNNGIAVLGIEKIIWSLIFAGTMLLSLWLICSSIFALYIVTLPDMTPLRALRSARELVRYRRWTLLIKILYLPLLLLIIMAIIVAPVVILSSSFAPAVLFVLAMLALAIVHGYMYNLYRELLND